jgi:DNA-binding transcriptional regulator PaaX
MYVEKETHGETAFIKKYPLAPKEAICVPMILQSGFFRDRTLPPPTMFHIRDFTEYAGITDAALRTTVSRLKKDGFLVQFTDANGIGRYRMSELALSIGAATEHPAERPDGFTLAVFSFAREQESERSFLRDTLKYYGFRKLAQNAYINGRIATDGLRKAVTDAGLSGHLFLFDCSATDDTDFSRTVFSLFGIEERAAYLREFGEDLRAFVGAPRGSDADIARRMMYSAAVHWNICHRDESAYPPGLLPPDYPLKDLLRLEQTFLTKNAKTFERYYSTLEKEHNR